MKKYHIILFFFFLAGFLFRIFLIHSYPQPFVYDQLQYHEYAKGILNYGLFAHSFRLYGYPLFVALMYSLGGEHHIFSIPIWQIYQAFLDTSTGLMVFFIAGKVLTQKHIVWGSYILYLFNPFTSAYTGVLLAEVLTIFLLTFLFLLLAIAMERKRPAYLIGTCFLLGYIPQVRPAFTYFTLFLLLWILWSIFQQYHRRLKYILIAAVFFFIPYVYTIFGNYVYYKEFNVADVDNYALLNFYVSLYVEKSASNLTSIWDYPLQVTWAYTVYPNHEEATDRHRIQRQFLSYAIEKVKENPIQFLWWRIEKMFFVWEKPTLFPYNNQDGALFSQGISWINSAILSFGMLGILWYRKCNKVLNPVRKTFFIISVFLFLYISLIHTVTECLPRYSLPAYPFVFLYTSIGLSFVYVIAKTIIVRKKIV